LSRIVFLIFLFLAISLPFGAGAQNKTGKKQAKTKPAQIKKTRAKVSKPKTVQPKVKNNQKPDSQNTKAPTITVLKDSSGADSLVAVVDPGKSDLDEEVKYTAEDSVIYDAAASKVYLYHNAQVEYTNLTLKAEYIEIDLVKSLAFARGKTDSTGKLNGKPVFNQGSEKYVANEMTYNFKTKRAKIQGIVTQQGEGYIHGESVKKTPENEMYIRDAQYTTCNLEHPHFHIQASKIKLIPNKKLVTGPFNLHFMDVPTPFGFGLGIFPTPQTAASGIIVPTYGEAVDRGFFLRNGGYYWHVNDYVDARFLGDIYSKGSYGFSVIANYKKRYLINGNVDIRYNKRIAGDDNLSPVGEDFWINWNHTPETRGTSSFSASVNLGTSTFNQRNSFSTNNYLSSTFSSNISYSKTFRGTPFNLGINARQQQNVVSKQVDLDLPTLNLNMNRIFPFKRGSSSGKTWYEKIGVAYTMALQNSLSNKFAKSAFVANPSKPDTIIPMEQRNFNTLLRGMRNGMRHSIPISTSFNMLKYLQVAPGFNYDEIWYLQRLDYQWDPLRKAVRTDTLRQFSRAYNFNTSVSFQTRIYGIFFIKKGGIEAIRHILNPTIGFTYRPDLSDPRFGMMKEVQVNENGRTGRLSPFANGIFGGTPTIGRTGALSFALNNTFEMKVKNRKDTTGKDPFKKINLLDNLNLSSSYNLAADSFQLAPISISARTTLFQKLNINLNGVLDPYAYRAPVVDENGKILIAQRRTPIYSWNAGRGIGQLSTFNLAMSTSLNPKARDKKVLPKKAMNPQMERELEFINNNPDLYVDFNIPWNLSISYNFTYSKTGFDKAALMQSMTFSGDVNLTPKWKVGFNSGYDFINKTLVYPNINIYRDLHCWEMRFNWIPTGTRGSYSIDINVKASVLQDLKLSRRRSWFDR
jgi:hypothetical protein